MTKHTHNLRAINNSSAEYMGVLLYCCKCGKAFGYDQEWKLVNLRCEDE